MIIRITDTETCGFAPDNAQLVEVATVDLIQEEGEWKRGATWSSLVNPGRPIPPEASAIHHITDDMVKDAPIAADLPDFLGGADILCAHNMKFDREVFALNRRTEAAEARWICSYKCGVWLYPEAPNHKNQTLRYFLGIKLADPSLASPHRALGDAYVTAALMRAYLRTAAPDEMVEVSGQPVLLPKFNFGKHAMIALADVPLDYLTWIVSKGAEFDEDVVYTAKHYLAASKGSRR